MSLASRLLASAKGLVPDAAKRAVRAYRWNAGRLDDLPGTSRHFGPPRRWVRAESYFRRHPGGLHQVLPRQAMPVLRVTTEGTFPTHFFSQYQEDVPPAGVLELPDARLLGPNGWIVGARDSYLLDASFWAYPSATMAVRDHYVLARHLAPPVRHLPGRTLSLASDFAIGGFGHFLHDSLPRLHLVELAGLDPAGFDWIYWPHVDTPATRQLVAASGLPSDRIITGNHALDFACDTLTATTFPGRPGHIAPVYADFLRHRFAPAPRRRDRKIYLSRAGFRRNFRNAAEIDAVLARHGYEHCHAHTDPAVFEKCAAATHVVAIEGASFFNAFACAAGTKALVIYPDGLHATPYTLSLALSAGFDLHVMAARSLDQPLVEAGIADIFLEPSILDAALGRMAQA